MVKRRANGSKKNAKKSRDDQGVPVKRRANGSKTKKAKKSRGKPSRQVIQRALSNTQSRPARTQLPNFPFKLSRLPFERIFGSLSPVDIIRFAMCSTTSYNLLNNNLRVGATRIMFDSHPSDISTQFFITVEAPNQKPCELKIWTSTVQHRLPSQKSLKVWGKDAKGKSGETYWITLVFNKRHDGKMIAEEMSKLVLNVFQTTNIEIESEGPLKDEFLFSCVRGVQHFSKVGIRWHTPNCVNSEELQHVLGTLSADAMFLNVFLPRLKYTGTINKRILKTSSASWLTGECLLNMNCEILIAQGTRLTTNDFNVFFNEWQTNLEKFENLELIRMEQHDRFPLDPEELCLEKWPPQGEYPRNINITHPENTWYCKRGDLLATLELIDDKVVMFCVWHEKYLTKQVVHNQLPERIRRFWSNKMYF